MATAPVTPAITNAIYNAVGVRIDDLPATTDKILKELERFTNSQRRLVLKNWWREISFVTS
ncbi:MAG: hypothetical protein A2170_02195 [Deltaproteobacteria bacterium RBG_13_53_10]|nr:MAG: hypothetical protein A2170_02195 [Deltaproteobacteria bacterium RBG_13_53_10]